MKVSIITVAFNSAKTIEDTIKSVLAQTHNDVEYIIIDGQSTDETLRIVERYKNHTFKVISEPDKGIYDAMNKGLSLATGDVVGILNSDDVFESDDVLSIVAEQFVNDKSVEIVYGDLVYVSSNDLSKIKRRWLSKAYYENFFDDGHVPPHPTLYLKRSVCNIAGGFNLKYKLAADYEFMLRVFKNNKFKSIHIAKVMVRMRLGGATNKDFNNIFIGNQEILKSWKDNGLKAPINLMPKRIYRRLIQFI